MAVLRVRTYPDDILRETCEEVSTFDTELGQLLDDMAETMYEENGVGLAAPQIGITKRITVIDVSEDDPDIQEFINPRIVAKQGKRPSEEGCLSIPGFRETVKRAESITVEAQNRQGERFAVDADGLLAICLQHEIDHLDGVLFIDHLSRIKREMFKRWFKKQDGLEE